MLVLQLTHLQEAGAILESQMLYQIIRASSERTLSDVERIVQARLLLRHRVRFGPRRPVSGPQLEVFLFDFLREHRSSRQYNRYIDTLYKWAETLS